MYVSRCISVLVLLIVCSLRFGVVADAQDQAMQSLNPRMPAKMVIDDDRVQANGIKKIQGKHLDLYTDLRDQSDIAELVKVFDLAVNEWCEYFGVDVSATEGYRLSGFLIEDKPRFRRAGLMPADLPDFLAGYNRGHEFWVYLQPGEYYTRHLVLHEGTHAFMQWFLGGSGPSWYSEGMAEKLALHRWSDGQLTLNFRATDRNQVEYWGRPKLIREARKANQLKTIEDVIAINGSDFRQVAAYAWSWTLCEFLSQHPATCNEFALLTKTCSDTSSQFSFDLLQQLRTKRDAIDRDWQLFLNERRFASQSFPGPCFCWSSRKI